MASRIKVIGAYRPGVEQGNTVQKSELIRAVSRATNLTEGMVDLVIKEVRDQIIVFNRSGGGVKVGGFGTYSPNVGLDATLDVQYRADTALNKGLNVPGTFSGTSLNRENIGKAGEELVGKWNADHPNDQVEG